jgi:DNA-binding CsgD family transcriptional regulator
VNATQQTERFSAAIEAVYAASALPSAWPDALSAIASCTDDVGSVLIYIRDDGTVGTIASPELRAAQAEYERRWWREDIRASRTFQLANSSENEAITDRDVVAPAEIECHPIYREFLIPHGLGWYCASSISPDPRVNAFISVQRRKSKRPFSDDERQVVAKLARHAERSLRLGIRLLTAEATSSSLAEAMERVRVGVFVLDYLGLVLFQNAAARAAVGDGLAIVRGCLRAQINADRERLAIQITKVARDGAVDVGPVLVHRKSSERPLVLYILPVGKGAQGFGAQFLVKARALVLVLNSQRDAPADPAIVRDVLSITLGEARVAALVGSGIGPREAAERLGVSENTARNLLKRVFAKTGVARQSELARLLTTLVLTRAE